MRILGLTIGGVALCLGFVVAQDSDVAAIEQLMDEYVALLAEGDGEAVAAFYDTDAVMARGTIVAVGRDAIAQMLTDTRFANPLPLTRQRLQLLSATVAVAHGTFGAGDTHGQYLRVLGEEERAVADRGAADGTPAILAGCERDADRQR